MPHTNVTNNTQAQTAFANAAAGVGLGEPQGGLNKDDHALWVIAELVQWARAVRTLTTSDAVMDTDGTVRLDCSAAAITATLPAAATVTGQTFALLKVDTTGRIGTIACTGAETISGFATVTLEEQGAGVRVQSNGTSYDVLP